MKYTAVFILSLCLGLTSCTQDNKEMVSTEARIQEIIASEEFQNAYPVTVARTTSTEEALETAQIYEALLASLKEKSAPGTNIYEALREAISDNERYDETTKKSVLELIDDREKTAEQMQLNMQKLLQKFPELKNASFRSQMLEQVQKQQQVTR